MRICEAVKLCRVSGLSFHFQSLYIFRLFCCRHVCTLLNKVFPFLLPVLSCKRMTLLSGVSISLFSDAASGNIPCPLLFDRMGCCRPCMRLGENECEKRSMLRKEITVPSYLLFAPFPRSTQRILIQCETERTASQALYVHRYCSRAGVVYLDLGASIYRINKETS